MTGDWMRDWGRKLGGEKESLKVEEWKGLKAEEFKSRRV
jgi:hypothetical protein